MAKSALVAFVRLLVCCLLGCSESAESPREQAATLTPGVLVRVGSESISSSYVTQVAKLHGLALPEAQRRVVGEALLAEAARERFRGTGLVTSSERAVRARALLEELQAQARADGLPTDEELSRLRSQRWMDLDRPVSVETAHAVVLSKGPEQQQLARAAAEKIAEVTAGIGDVDEFMKKAKQVHIGEFEARVERLPHMTSDGRAVFLDPLDPRRARPPKFDVLFASTANAIPEPGQQSSVVETRFGYHVIFLVERVAAQHATLDELRRRFADDVYASRAKLRLEELKRRLRQQTPVEVTRNVEELTERVFLQP